MYINISSYLVRNDTAKIYSKAKQKNRNFVFAVQSTDIIPIYAFRAIPLT